MVRYEDLSSEDEENHKTPNHAPIYEENFYRQEHRPVNLVTRYVDKEQNTEWTTEDLVYMYCEQKLYDLNEVEELAKILSKSDIDENVPTIDLDEDFAEEVEKARKMSNLNKMAIETLDSIWINLYKQYKEDLDNLVNGIQEKLRKLCFLKGVKLLNTLKNVFEKLKIKSHSLKDLIDSFVIEVKTLFQKLVDEHFVRYGRADGNSHSGLRAGFQYQPPNDVSHAHRNYVNVRLIIMCYDKIYFLRFLLDGLCLF